MRNDLASMNGGKAMAQSHHAGCAFVKDIGSRIANMEVTNLTAASYGVWRNSTNQDCGTVLTLAVNEAQMRFTTEAAERYGLVSGIFHDPTYPLRDGATTHFIPLDTCGWVFTDKNDPVTDLLLGNFPLHP